MNDALKNTLSEIVGKERLIENAPMKEHISFRVGGPADLLVMPADVDALIAVLSLLRKAETPYYLIGNGSNLLVRDGGFRGVIIKTRDLDRITVEDEVIIAEAGAMLSKVAATALKAGLEGLAFASGIPGSIGGAVMMNAGAYGGEMKDVIESVDYLTTDGEIRTIAGTDCGFGYRTSIFKENGATVLRVRLRLKAGDPTQIEAEMRELNGRRREKQPLEYPSAGSTFKRPEGYFAGKLIQDCGLKGYAVGGAAVSEKHAGFVINKDHATAQDVIDLITHIQQTVRSQTGVDLETEVIIIGEELAMCN